MGPTLHRAAVFAALGEPARLTIVDALMLGDVSPGRLAGELGMGTNLLAHHLRVLEQAGVVGRARSEGDRRRSYIRLRLDDPTVHAAVHAGPAPAVADGVSRVLFVCTANSARSQLAAATWNRLSPIPAASAGTRPARRVHPRAITVARRHGLHLEQAVPADIHDVIRDDDLLVAVCDNAYEELGGRAPGFHWSIPDPARSRTAAAFEEAYADVAMRAAHLNEGLLPTAS
jgi:protein-tyrosine-phosphatase/DNA-binding transcriptional ArsR family regulator